MRTLFFLLVAASFAVSDASSDQILILSKSSSPLWHKTRSSDPVSTAGMADLALNSLGLSTGRISSRPAGQSPVQADIFTNSEAYAIILSEGASLATLDTIHAALGGAQIFNELYPAQPANIKVSIAVAQQFKSKYPSATYCAGSIALCASVSAETLLVETEVVQEVLKVNSFLSSSDEQDMAFAQQLAELKSLTTELKHIQGKKLLLVGISGLQGDKQNAAQQAMTTAVTEFLAELMKNERLVAAQMMTGTLPTAAEQAVALSRRTRNRKLVSKQKKDKENDDAESTSDSEENDEEDGEDEDIAAASSSKMDDDNSTSTTNSTSRGAVSMPDIAEYQIILWTSVLLGAMLLIAIMAMVNMNVGRDSLLYAKFNADVNGRKID